MQGSETISSTIASRAGSIIFLNRTPSAGKSTLARALRDAFDEPVFYQSLDDFRLSVPERFWSGSTAVERLFAPMRAAYLVMLREVAARGVPVIAEAVVMPEFCGLHDELFGDLDVLLVGVLCPLDVVEQREAARTDRLNGPQEVTADEVELAHQHAYALTVDAVAESTAEAVARVLTAWKRSRSASPHEAQHLTLLAGLFSTNAKV